jgi:energy-coupling factor transport system ATP-binding protein
VDLEVGEGEFVVIMGASGTGKSTLCVSLNGLIPNFLRGRMEGEVRIRNRSTREGKVGEFAREVGLVFQDFEAQLFSTNVELEVARMRPTAVGMGVDALTPEQEEFLRG